MATKVYVAIDKKLDPRDAAHWAIWLEGSGGRNAILQTGDDLDNKVHNGYFVEKPTAKCPDSSALLDETIKCGTISEDHSFTSLVDMLQGLPVNNNSTTWNCQNWVMAALEVLKRKGLEIASTVMGNLTSKRENPPYSNTEAPEAGKSKAGSSK